MTTVVTPLGLTPAYAVPEICAVLIYKAVRSVTRDISCYAIDFMRFDLYTWRRWQTSQSAQRSGSNAGTKTQVIRERETERQSEKISQEIEDKNGT